MYKRSEAEEEAMGKELRRKIDKIERKMCGCLGIPKDIIDNRKAAMDEEKKNEKYSRTFD